MLPHYCVILAAAAPRIFRPFFSCTKTVTGNLSRLQFGSAFTLGLAPKEVEVWLESATPSFCKDRSVAGEAIGASILSAAHRSLKSALDHREPSLRDKVSCILRMNWGKLLPFKWRYSAGSGNKSFGSIS